jgi:hypothetical protein
VRYGVDVCGSDDKPFGLVVLNFEASAREFKGSPAVEQSMR